MESGKSDNRRWVRIGRDDGGTTERLVTVTILEKVETETLQAIAA